MHLSPRITRGHGGLHGFHAFLSVRAINDMPGEGLRMLGDP
jgi:hypothetical protein